MVTMRWKKLPRARRPDRAVEMKASCWFVSRTKRQAMHDSDASITFKPARRLP
jgi:hypothetical protein